MLFYSRFLEFLQSELKWVKIQHNSKNGNLDQIRIVLFISQLGNWSILAICAPDKLKNKSY